MAWELDAGRDSERGRDLQQKGELVPQFRIVLVVRLWELLAGCLLEQGMGLVDRDEEMR